MDWTVTVGRRKTSVARVFIRAAAKAGAGSFEINHREFEDYFPVSLLRLKTLEPFEVLDKAIQDFDVKVNVNGGGITGQAEAIRMGFARAFVEMDAENRSPLKAEGLLTRDPRMVERKKYGKPKARKSFQFSKR
ncbi:MAG: 30S ribosomal protein S9 [Bacteroidia bacterium]|nr:30S ribosomal protein S9 [Bacteroidia bacterium]